MYNLQFYPGSNMTTPNTYDIAIVGGGLAGLTLAWKLHKIGYTQTHTVVVIETREEYDRDKIWSFWNVFNLDLPEVKLGQWYNQRTVVLDVQHCG